MQPALSVIIPVFNSEEYLGACLESILCHSEINLEIICVNDGSTDNSPLVLEDYASRFPDKITVINQPNAGQGAARNSGIACANGKYIWFIDSDDLCGEVDLSELINIADSNELDLITFDLDNFREDSISDDDFKAYQEYYNRKPIGEDVISGVQLAALQKNVDAWKPSPCIFLVRRQYLLQIGLKFEPRMIHEDNPFAFELVVRAQRTLHLPIKAYLRRLRPGSIMTARQAIDSAMAYFTCYIIMEQTLESLPKLTEFQAKYLGKIIAHTIISATQALDSISVNEYDEFTLEGANTQPKSQVIAEIVRVFHNQNKSQANHIAELEQQINDIQSSRTWKTGKRLLSPLQTTRKLFGKLMHNK